MPLLRGLLAGSNAIRSIETPRVHRPARGERAGGGWIGVMGEAAPEAAARFSLLSPPGPPTRPSV
jgi:hypothetical protein